MVWQRKGNIMGQSESAVPAAPSSPILEVAVLDVRPGMAGAFRQALGEALPLIRRQPGCLGAEVRPCLEDAHQFILLATWARPEDHEPGFRQSADYRRWRELLHRFYDPFPVVKHFGPPLAGGGPE